MKKTLSYLSLVALLFIALPSVAAKNYIYRNRANWVKLEKLSNKQLAGQKLNHPYQGFNSEQLAGMLQSISLNKGMVLSKEVKAIEVFTPEEAKKFAPLIIQGLSQATPNQIVNMAIVHKRPYYVMRNDYISVINIYVQDNSLHLNFRKLYAKLEGDYKQSSQLDQSIRKAKSVRVGLAVSSKGQTLSDDGNEIIFDLDHDFLIKIATVDSEIQTTQTKKQTVPNQMDAEPSVMPDQAQQDVAARLKTLEKLRKDKLISESEFQEKKFKILEEL